MLTIAIIALIGIVGSFLYNTLYDNSLHINMPLGAIAVLTWWNICLPLSIILICVIAIINIIGVIYKYL
jgi:hypothetical protein